MLYVDVDAFCKLAHWNILPLLPDLTGYQWNNIATLSSLKYRVNRSIERPDGKLFHMPDAAKIAFVYLSKMVSLPQPEPDRLAQFANVLQIDSGEAILLSLTAGDTQACFLTGDKRALRAISQLDCAPDFAGRVIIIEQILLLCLKCKGREWLLQNVCPYRHIDKAISIILGSQCDGSIESIEEGIISYIQEIAQLQDPKLLFRFSQFE